MNNKGKEKSKAKFRGLTLLRGKWRTAAACISLLQLAVVGHGPLLVGHGQDESVKAGCVTAPLQGENHGTKAGQRNSGEVGSDVQLPARGAGGLQLACDE
jgi:hypothetical protein